MTLISKATGTLSLASCIVDMHKVAKVEAKKASNVASANAIVSDSLNAQKISRMSFKDAKRKDWLSSKNYFIGVKETFAKITGYIKGFLKAGIKYIPNFALATVALLAKNKDGKNTGSKIANIAAAGLAILEGFDFIKNSTKIGENTDYLKY